MKQLLKMGLAFVLVTGMMLFAGCPQPGSDYEYEDDGETTWIDGINWGNHVPGGNHGFIVDNRSGHDLVAFHGSVGPGTLLGGVRRGHENHGIYRDPSVFNVTRSVHVVFVREEDLIRHNAEDTLNQLNANPFVSLMVLYNHGQPNNHRHGLTNRAGGRHRLIVANPTDNNVELRINSPLAGGTEVLGFSPRRSMSTVFYLNDHVSPPETLIFPVFRFFHPVDQAVSEIFPLFPDHYEGVGGTPWFLPLAAGVGMPAINATIDLNTVMNSFNVALGAVWVVVENVSTVPITFFQGTSAMPDSMGAFQISNVVPHNRRTMVFNARGAGGGGMGAGDGRGQVLPYLNIGDLGVGVTVATRTATVRAHGDSAPFMPTFQLRSDYRYRIVVSGSMAALTATLYLDGAPRNAPEPINVAELMQQGH